MNVNRDVSFTVAYPSDHFRRSYGTRIVIVINTKQTGQPYLTLHQTNDVPGAAQA